MKSWGLKTTYLSAAGGMGAFVTAALVLAYYLAHRAAPDPTLLTNGPVKETARWLFWQGHPPLIW